MRLELTVNGEPREIDGAWGGESLLYALRERLGLPGAKNACEQGECGSCSVYLDGDARLRLPRARRAGGGPRGRHRRGARARRRAARAPARVRRGGRRAVRLLHARADRREPRPAAARPDPSEADIREALAGNLCRCTGYAKIIDAVQLAAERLAMSVVHRRRSRPTSAARPDRRQPAARRRRAEGARRVRVRVRPAAPRGCCGARRCAARTRAPASSRSTPPPRPRCRACTPCSPTPTCPAARRTGSSSPTSRCSR